MWVFAKCRAVYGQGFSLYAPPKLLRNPGSGRKEACPCEKGSIATPLIKHNDVRIMKSKPLRESPNTSHIIPIQ